MPASPPTAAASSALEASSGALGKESRSSGIHAGQRRARLSTAPARPDPVHDASLVHRRLGRLFTPSARNIGRRNGRGTNWASRPRAGKLHRYLATVSYRRASSWKPDALRPGHPPRAAVDGTSAHRRPLPRPAMGALSALMPGHHPGETDACARRKGDQYRSRPFWTPAEALARKGYDACVGIAGGPACGALLRWLRQEWSRHSLADGCDTGGRSCGHPRRADNRIEAIAAYAGNSAERARLVLRAAHGDLTCQLCVPEISGRHNGAITADLFITAHHRCPGTGQRSARHRTGSVNDGAPCAG